MNDNELVVVKYGSSCVAGGEGPQENIKWYSEQLARLHEQYSLIVVSSGAVALGETVLGGEFCNETEDDQTKQLLAMSGNPYLMATWIEGLAQRGISSGELLLTHKEIEDDREPDSPGSELKKILQKSIDVGYVPIINENDALSRRELAKLEYGGDNDGLAAHVACSMGASALFLMTNTNGVRNGRARIKHVKPCEQSWESVQSYAGPPNARGRGGMRAKVDAGIKSARQGIEAFVAPADKSFRSIMEGSYGSYFEPATPGSRIN